MIANSRPLQNFSDRNRVLVGLITTAILAEMWRRAGGRKWIAPKGGPEMGKLLKVS